MFETKLFEIRDRHTLICALAIRFDPTPRVRFAENLPATSRARWMFRRIGFAPDEPITYLMKLDGRAEYDPFQWEARTLREAHLYIEKHWNELEPGQVIDVQHFLGETAEPKRTEQTPE